MRKTIGKPVDVSSRQANSEESASSVWVIHDSFDLDQTAPGNFGIGVNEPKDVAARGTRASIHLYCPIAFGYDKLIAKPLRQIARAVGASTIRDNDLRSNCPLTHVSKKRLYQRRLINNWDDDRNLHPDLAIILLQRDNVRNSQRITALIRSETSTSLRLLPCNEFH
jgi:hypothetical protein